MNKSRLICILALALALCAPLLAGCGKKGPPKPRVTARSYVWQHVEAAPVAGCLDVQAVMSGVYTSLNSVILELDPMRGPDDCPGCPFQVRESYVVTNLAQNFDAENGYLRFSYCPLEPSPAYRLRLVGANASDGARNAVSAETLVLMQPE
ncbi:hypothetical protein LJC36_00750 [Desulfovibrio sp. OttesenSCG-928-C14]|nr:hypothetical protein [Desulfovibrio sp. OttesenSCG-928-C14]